MTRPPAEPLPPDRCRQVHRLMARARALEVRSLQMSKSGEGLFWIGAPGEEAFSVCLGLHVRRGRGPAFDFLHLHYRGAPVMLALGMDPADHLRQMAMRATDPYSAGRNFVGHYSVRDWNVVPVSSVIAVQYAMAPGSALVQKRLGGEGVTVVTGGEAGTAAGDFTSCLLWASRPGSELPLLTIVTNNGYGISTPTAGQIGDDRLVARAAAFGMPAERVDGNDPEACWAALTRAFDHCRTQRKPYFLEATVSRLHGHSSSSGGARVAGEIDCLDQWERTLADRGVLSPDEAAAVREAARAEVEEARERVMAEPTPEPASRNRHVYAPSPVDVVYPDDYTGLPGVSPPVPSPPLRGRGDRGEPPEYRMATLAQAVRLALHYGETHLGVTDVFGEDVGPPLGGVFTATQGLRTAWNSPLDERGIVGAAMGIAWAGGRPVAEIQFADYAFNAMDLLKLAGNQRWAGAGEWELPLVLMTPSGAGIHGSLYHSHCLESWASRLPGWKVVMPSRPIDAYGLMLSAIADPNPVMVLLPKALMRVAGAALIPGEPASVEELRRRIDAPPGDRTGWVPDWPEVGPLFVPLGRARVCRAGDDATVVSYGRTLPLCEAAADALAAESGARVEVIDLRTLFPYDWPCVRESVRRTGRVLFVNEDTEITNLGEHLLRRTIDECFYELTVRPRLLQAEPLPGIGLHPDLEDATVPGPGSVRRALAELLADAA